MEEPMRSFIRGINLRGSMMDGVADWSEERQVHPRLRTTWPE